MRKRPVVSVRVLARVRQPRRATAWSAPPRPGSADLGLSSSAPVTLTRCPASTFRREPRTSMNVRVGVGPARAAADAISIGASADAGCPRVTGTYMFGSDLAYGVSCRAHACRSRALDACQPGVTTTPAADSPRPGHVEAARQWVP